MAHLRAAEVPSMQGSKLSLRCVEERKRSLQQAANVVTHESDALADVMCSWSAALLFAWTTAAPRRHDTMLSAARKPRPLQVGCLAEDTAEAQKSFLLRSKKAILE